MLNTVSNSGFCAYGKSSIFINIQLHTCIVFIFGLHFLLLLRAIIIYMWQDMMMVWIVYSSFITKDYIVTIIGVSYALTRAHVSDMFFNAELEDEYHSNDNSTWKRSKKQDWEEKLKEVVEDGVGMTYMNTNHVLAVPRKVKNYMKYNTLHYILLLLYYIKWSIIWEWKNTRVYTHIRGHMGQENNTTCMRLKTECVVYTKPKNRNILSKNYSISTIAVPFDRFQTVLQL